MISLSRYVLFALICLMVGRSTSAGSGIALHLLSDGVVSRRIAEPTTFRTVEYSSLTKEQEWSYAVLQAEAPNNIAEDVVNRHLADPKTCRIFGLYSSSVEEDRVARDSRTKVVGYTDEGKQYLNRRTVKRAELGRDLLRKCEELKSSIGSDKCKTLDISGHASGQSIGIAHTLVLDYRGGMRRQLPEDDGIFNAIGQCFQEITFPESPIIFSTCGGYRDHAEGSPDYFFPGKVLAQQEMSRRFNRQIVSAIGGVSSWGPTASYSRHGWFRSDAP